MKYYLKVLSKYVDFSGRARRSEYWYFTLFNFIISVILSIADEMLNTKLIGLVYTLAVIMPSLAVGVRRMHDVGKSGWFLLIPIYNLILAFTEGTSGDNQYGADPKNEAIVFE